MSGERWLIDTDILVDFLRGVPETTMAQKGRLYKRDFWKSHGTGLADAIIAATADELNLTLATLNKKHYHMLKDIKVPYQK